jgi:hypothetical protein
VMLEGPGSRRRGMLEPGDRFGLEQGSAAAPPLPLLLIGEMIRTNWRA